MKTYIIQLPDDFDWTDPCLRCPYEPMCGMTINLCPLSKAREAVEVCLSDSLTRTFEGKEIVKHNGKPVKLFAVDDKQ